MRHSTAYAASTRATLKDWRRKMISEKRMAHAAGKLSEKTVKFYIQKSGHFERIWTGELKLSDITPDLVDDYRERRGRESATHHTISKEFTALRQILKIARRANVFDGDMSSLFPIGYGTGYVPREVVLTEEDEATMKRDLPPHRWAVVAFILATSARRSEVWAATTDDWSAKDNVMTLRGTKTKRSLRDVPVLDEHLHYMRDALEHMPFKWPSISQDLPRFCERIGVQRYVPNDLRRTHSTRLAEMGADPYDITKNTGHSNLRMLQRVYDRTRVTKRRERIQAAIRNQRESEKGSDSE